MMIPITMDPVGESPRKPITVSLSVAGGAKGYRLHLKLDCLQPTGSFRVRAAFDAGRPVDVEVGGVGYHRGRAPLRRLQACIR
ncbi:MAG: hypothetical protein ACE5E8_02275 [Acidimicrobiia bacterium]